MRASLGRIGLALLLGIVCAASVYAAGDVSIGTPGPTPSPCLPYPADELTSSQVRPVDGDTTAATELTASDTGNVTVPAAITGAAYSNNRGRPRGERLPDFLDSDHLLHSPGSMVPVLVDNLDGTITDTISHLMWLKNANLAGVPMSWQAAVNWADDLVYAGHDDWRLPSGRNPDGSVCDSRMGGSDCPLTEFASLHFIWGIHGNAPGPFEDLEDGSYWTSTACPSNPDGAMSQDLDDGGQVDFPAGTACFAWAVRDTGAGTVSADDPAPAQRTRIVSAFPNPARERVAVRFELARSSDVELTLFDIAGRQVRSWALGVQSAGRHEVVWMVRDSPRGASAPGLYQCRLRTARGEDTKSILVLR